MLLFFVFFFQAEDGIRDWSVTGVQTCALPIYARQAADEPVAAGKRVGARPLARRQLRDETAVRDHALVQIGRASCRERVENSGGAVRVEKKMEGRSRKLDVWRHTQRE